MAEFATIARPYAKALFELANEKHQIESWLSGLRELAWSVAQARVASLIEDTRTNSKEKLIFYSNCLLMSRLRETKLFVILFM